MNPREYSNILYDALEARPQKQHTQILKKFKFLLVKNKDAHLANAILKEFKKIQEQKGQERTIYITSASKLSLHQKKELENISSEPRIFSVNSELLGGIAIRQNDKILNSTLRKRVELMKHYFLT